MAVCRRCYSYMCEFKQNEMAHTHKAWKKAAQGKRRQSPPKENENERTTKATEKQRERQSGFACI